MKALFKHDDFQFEYEIVLGSIYRGFADVGEVQVTATSIKDGDADEWVSHWTALGESMENAARSAESAGHRLSSADYSLRAANYLSTALSLIDRSKVADQRLALWRRHRTNWDRWVDIVPPRAERVNIPYESTTMSAYFFPAPDSKPGEGRPLVIMNNGSDGTTPHMALQGGLAAAERGYHWLTFDGPGQQSMLFERGIPFRPDWEAVLTPVLDAVLARRDVLADRIAVIGVSQAGYWVPRALAFEHRLTAAVVDPGVVDVSTSWTSQLPGFMRKQLHDESKKKAFDEEMGWAERLSKSTRATLHFRGEPYGVSGSSPFDLYQEVLKYRLGDEVSQISTPMLITDPEDEQFWPEQSQRLYEMLPGTKGMAKFTAAEGANRHCEPMGLAVREARIFDWLDVYLAA